MVEGRAVRIGLLPAWPVLAAFVAMAALAVLWVARRSLPRTVTSAPIRLRVGALTLPLFSLVILAVPYMPVLPDIVRPLVMAAGPAKWVIWLAVVGLFFWTLWQGRVARADWLAQLTITQAATLIGLTTAIASFAASGFAPFNARAAIALMSGAAAATVMWKFVVQTTNSSGGATFAWAAVALTAPFLLSAAVDRQMVGSLFLVLAFVYVPERPTPMYRVARAIAVTAPAFALAWLTLAGAPERRVDHLVLGAPAILFDQQYGLLAYAPIYVLAATGLAAMMRADAAARARAVEIIAVLAILLFSAALLPGWWEGTTPPAAPLAAALFVLALPIAWTAREAPIGSVRRASHQLLLWASVGMAVMSIAGRTRFAGIYEAEGASKLLEYWSPAWPAWTAAPSFAIEPLSSAWLRTGTWLAAATAVALVLPRWRTRTAGGATLAAVAMLTLAVLLAAMISPRFPTVHRVPVTLDARAHLTLLDGFDREARPIAIEYTPFRFIRPEEVVSLASLSVGPGTRIDQQPIRILHNGRFSLPAGRYHLDIEWAEDLAEAVAIGLQVGLGGPPWQTWEVTPRRGLHWSADVNLPMDAPFVALRGEGDIERAIKHVSIQPTDVVDESQRPQLPAIDSASQMGTAVVLYHDEGASHEPTGFWVLGGQTARVTFAREAHDVPLTLRLHSGFKANRVQVSSRGWRETLYLNARTPQDLTLPDSERRVITVDLRAEDGFHPRDYDATSADSRFLGAWVEIAPLNR